MYCAFTTSKNRPGLSKFLEHGGPCARARSKNRHQKYICHSSFLTMTSCLMLISATKPVGRLCFLLCISLENPLVPNYNHTREELQYPYHILFLSSPTQVKLPNSPNVSTVALTQSTVSTSRLGFREENNMDKMHYGSKNKPISYHGLAPTKARQPAELGPTQSYIRSFEQPWECIIGKDGLGVLIIFLWVKDRRVQAVVCGG